MQISLRSHLVAGVAAAGAVAVMGAGVVTVPQAAHVPTLPSAAAVALAGFDNPIEELIDTAQLVQNYLLASYYNGADVPTPGAGEANWQFAGFDQTGGDVLNYLLAQTKSLGYYNNVGLLPQIVNTNQPIVTQLTTNWLGYLNTGITGVLGAADAAAAGVWNFPAAAIEAAQLLFDGQLQAALAVLAEAIVTPITTAVDDLFGAVGQVARDIVAKLVAVVQVIPTNLKLFGGWLLGGGSLLVQEAVALGTQWAQELVSGNFEGAWNTAVAGLLGPSGLPGTAFNVSLGAGVQTGAIVNPQTDIEGNFIPSLRTAIQGTLWNTQEALTTVAPPAAATVAPAAAAELPAAQDVSEQSAEAAAESVAVAVAVTEAEAEETPATAPAVRVDTRAASAAADSGDAPAKTSRATRASRGSAGN